MNNTKNNININVIMKRELNNILLKEVDFKKEIIEIFT